MGVDYRDARMGMAEANFAAGDFSRAVEDSAAKWTPVRLSKKEENIAGVKIPFFKLLEFDHNSESNLLGLSMGGQSIQNAKDKFTKFLQILVQIATLQT